MADLTPRPSDEYCQDVNLTTGQIVGLSFTAQAGFISATAVVILLMIVASKYRKRVQDTVHPSWRLIKTNIDGLMLNLLIADLFMSLGAILDVKWASERKVSCGTHCNAQGAIQLIGETAVALFTLAITLLTFISIFRGQAVRYRFAVWGGVSIGVWLFVLLWAVIGHAVHDGKDLNDSFYAPTPYWCWISPKYKAERLIGEYVWLWIAGFGNIFLYTPLFFMLRGNITWEPEFGWRSLQWRWRTPTSTSRSEGALVDSKDTESVMSVQGGGMSPYTLLWYPLAYTVCVLPLSVVRWIMFGRNDHSSPELDTAAFVAVSIFNLSGLVNVALILFTRTNVLLLCPRSGSPDTSNSSIRQGQNGNNDTRYQEVEDPVSDHAPGETGFGGPRVILRDDDSDFDTGRINRGASPRIAADPLQSDASALGLSGLRGETRSPGRAYIESLGVGRNSQA